MKIKAAPKQSRKQKAYLKWMGLTPPKSQGRLAQLNKHNRPDLHKPSEFLVMAKSQEQVEGSE